MKLWWKNKGRVRGWTGVCTGSDGTVGVSVHASIAGGGKPQVVKCGAIPEAEPDADALVRLSHQISVSGFPWVLMLDRGDYNVIVMPEPPVLPSEMEQSVRWSLGTMIDYPVEEANVALMHVPTREYLPGRPPQIYVIVARNEIIQHHSQAYFKAKLPLEAVDVRETAQRNIAALLEKPGEGVGLLVMGGRGVEIIFTFKGDLFLDRFVEEPLDQILSSGEEDRKLSFDHIALQVQRSIDHINRTLPFMVIGRIVVAPLPHPFALHEHLAQSITVPVETMDLSEIFDLSLVPELKAVENQARYFTALGAALRGLRRAP